MKTNLILTTTICICLLILLTSCGSSKHKTNEVFDRVRLERMTTKISDTNTTENTIVSDISKKTPIKKEIKVTKETKPIKSVEIVDEWMLFKTETDKKILTNENKIKEIKEIPQPKPKLVRKLTRLENSNNGLVKQMNNYNKTTKPDWENFKQKMNTDVERIRTDLIELAMVDKK